MKYYAIQRSNTLAHYGIKGMRWGVRRYQDYDGHLIGSRRRQKTKGKLFGFGKKNKVKTAKRGDTLKSLDEYTKTAYDNPQEQVEYDKQQPASLQGISDELRNAIKGDDTLRKINEDYWHPVFETARIKDSEDHEKAMNAANLGLKALQDLGRWEPDGEKISGSEREWFLFEDQTIGFPTIAHLINKGHSAEDVTNFVGQVNGVYYNHHFDKDYEKYFDVIEGFGLDEFAKACERVKNDRRSL